MWVEVTYSTSRTGCYQPSTHDAPTSFSSPQLDAQGPPGSHLMQTVEPQDGICTPDSRLGGGRPAIGNTHFGLYVRKEQTSAALEPRYTFDLFRTAASITLPDTVLPGTDGSVHSGCWGQADLQPPSNSSPAPLAENQNGRSHPSAQSPVWSFHVQTFLH